MNLAEFLLTSVAEEAAEIGHAAAKCSKYGLTDAHPDRENIPNYSYLANEVNDLLGTLEFMTEQGIFIPGINDPAAKKRRKIRLVEYMRYAAERGTLSMILEGEK